MTDMNRPSRTAETRSFRFRRKALAFLLVLSAVLATFAPALASPAFAAWNVDTTTRTQEDVIAKWQQFRPTYTGSPYAVVPSVVAPYTAGDAASSFRADGLGTINFARYLAGLPYDVSLDAGRNQDAQYGAVLLTTISGLSHTPPKPADMDQAFYDRGYASTSSSNIGSGFSDSESFQKACLAEADSTNIKQVGHRRWLLNPRMKVTGIGYAESRHTTYAFDTSRPSGEVTYDYIAWPSAGYFPVEFISSATPWSITLNPSRYDWDSSGFTVVMRRVSDGATWTFNSADTNASGEYFGADFQGYGVANAFIFRPNPSSISYSVGDQFDITLSGGIYAEGTRTPASVSFRTKFMTLAGATSPDPSPGSTLMPIYRFYNRVNGSHFYTASATERDSVIAKYSATYTFEGAAYVVNSVNPKNNAPLYRFYNRVNGSHFYTASETERDQVIAKYRATYTYEGIAYSVSLNASGTTPVYRFYNRLNGSHFYTTSEAERENVTAKYSATYTYEGVAFFIGG
ncbi:MAG: CAP domain-containing protein [Coriobacteriia bacterium]